MSKIFILLFYSNNSWREKLSTYMRPYSDANFELIEHEKITIYMYSLIELIKTNDEYHQIVCLIVVLLLVIFFLFLKVIVPKCLSASGIDKSALNTYMKCP